MSFTREITLWCDVCGDWTQTSGTVARIRKAFKRDGWSRRGKEDLCPRCTRCRAGKDDVSDSDSENLG